MSSILGWVVAGLVTVAAALLAVFKTLWKRWLERIVDRLDQALLRGISRYDRQYREELLASLRFIDLKGLATLGSVTPELDDVFVDVSLAYRSPHEVPQGVLASLPVDVTDRHAIDDFLDKPRPAVLAVVGVPGSGKTTLLKHTARRICRERRRRRALPILLYLRDHVDDIVSNPRIELPALLRETLGAGSHGEPPGWLEKRLRDGDCVILLDGLDEVAREADRRVVAGWVERQTTRYPKNDFVITSRPHGYRTAPIAGAIVLQVRGFTNDQVERFVRGWYLAVERRSTGESTEDIRARAESAATDLLTRLHGAPSLYDLTINPLLLTMIANVHRYRGSLPGSRVDLYGEICEVMLWRRQEAKKLPIELAGNKKEALLRRLAFVMMQWLVRDAGVDDLVAELRPAMRRMPTRLTEREFLADVGSNGLLVERESGRFSFAHLTFQEYLAAGYIRDNGLVQVLADAVDDVWWRETTLLYAADADADPIVEACLYSGSVTALSLAFDIVDQGCDLAPELRDKLDHLLKSTDADIERRRLRHGVLTARHLREAVRTEQGTRICAHPISGDIYRFFLAETGTPPPDGHLAEDKPVTGARADDAVAFVNWANDITGGIPGYRLPTRIEINDPAVRRVLAPTLSVWLDRELWTPPDRAHPNQLAAETLASYVIADITRSTPTVARLLLLRYLIINRAFNRALDLDLVRAFEWAGSLSSDLASDLAHAIARSNAQSDARGLIHDLELAHALVRGRSGTPDVDRALAVDITLDRTPVALRRSSRTLNLGVAFNGTIDRAFARDLDRALACSLNRARVMDVGLDRARDLVGTQVMGKALSRSLSGTTHRKDWTLAVWLEKFTRAFVVETGTLDATYVVSMDTLPDALRRGRKELGAAPGTWADKVSDRLAEIALPLVTRREPITQDKAAAIRIASLCLAAEGDGRAADVAGDAYRELAAGITVLERRAKGTSPPTETIMLATS